MTILDPSAAADQPAWPRPRGMNFIDREGSEVRRDRPPPHRCRSGAGRSGLRDFPFAAFAIRGIGGATTGGCMKLTKEQIDEIVAAAYPTPHRTRARPRPPTSAFGERKNPYEMWRGSTYRSLRRRPVRRRREGGGWVLSRWSPWRRQRCVRRRPRRPEADRGRNPGMA